MQSEKIYRKVARLEHRPAKASVDLKITKYRLYLCTHDCVQNITYTTKKHLVTPCPLENTRTSKKGLARLQNKLQWTKVLFVAIVTQGHDQISVNRRLNATAGDLKQINLIVIFISIAIYSVIC